MKSVLVTGSDSQLAKCLKDRVYSYSGYEFFFKNSTQCDITHKVSIAKTFRENKFDYCINCAAYTSVDKAEEEPKKAELINAYGPKYLAQACKESNTILIHISTDFVFDGETNKPYLETDSTNPINVYGLTKRNGENEIMKSWKKHYIIRTSWLYSEYGHNFLKTIIGLSKNKNEIMVVNDQIGSPTYAGDLADVVLKIIISNKDCFGIYHHSNSGSVSWYDFAIEIISLEKLPVQLKAITTSQYKAKAKRPKNSVLNNDKAKETFDIKGTNWKVSLSKCIHLLNDLNL